MQLGCCMGERGAKPKEMLPPPQTLKRPSVEAAAEPSLTGPGISPLVTVYLGSR